MSIGVATYHPEQAKDEPVLQEVLAIIDALEKQSDEGMYKSKNAGKNKVSVMPEFSKVKYEIDLRRKKLPLPKKDLNPIDPFDLSRFDPIEY
ncbi:MAG: hypothetical protein GY817_08930 [bacterium]|nr:hypothetical protein [bacterium]